MTTKELDKQEWTKFFDELSRDRFGWKTRVEVLKDEIGAQVLSDGLPFGGLMFEEKNGGAIEIMLGEDAGAHQTHTIFNPQKVFLQTGDDKTEIVEIEDEEGAKILVYFTRQASVLIEYGETELVAQLQ